MQSEKQPVITFPHRSQKISSQYPQPYLSYTPSYHNHMNQLHFFCWNPIQRTQYWFECCTHSHLCFSAPMWATIRRKNNQRPAEYPTNNRRYRTTYSLPYHSMAKHGTTLLQTFDPCTVVLQCPYEIGYERKNPMECRVTPINVPYRIPPQFPATVLYWKYRPPSALNLTRTRHAELLLCATSQLCFNVAVRADKQQRTQYDAELLYKYNNRSIFYSESDKHPCLPYSLEHPTLLTAHSTDYNNYCTISQKCFNGTM